MQVEKRMLVKAKKLVSLKIILSEENTLRKQGRDDDASHA